MPTYLRGASSRLVAIAGALAALVIALGVSSAAADHTAAGGGGTVGTHQIKNNSVRSVDIRDGTIKLADMKQSTIDALEGEQGPPGEQGPAGPQGPQGPQGEPGPTGPVLPTIGHLLFVEDGSQEIAHLSYALDEPVALEDLDELTFFQELVHGEGSFGANVILGVDADEDGSYESNDLAWHLGATTHDPGVLGDDTFVEMDGTDPDTTKVEAPSVPQWWSPNEVGDGFAGPSDADCYNQLATLVGNCAGPARFDETDEVHVIRLVLGGSSSWEDIAIRLTQSIEGDLTTGLFDG